MNVDLGMARSVGFDLKTPRVHPESMCPKRNQAADTSVYSQHQLVCKVASG